MRELASQRLYCFFFHFALLRSLLASIAGGFSSLRVWSFFLCLICTSVRSFYAANSHCLPAFVQSSESDSSSDPDGEPRRKPAKRVRDRPKQTDADREAARLARKVRAAEKKAALASQGGDTGAAATAAAVAPAMAGGGAAAIASALPGTAESAATLARSATTVVNGVSTAKSPASGSTNGRLETQDGWSESAATGATGAWLSILLLTSLRPFLACSCRSSAATGCRAGRARSGYHQAPPEAERAQH